METAAKKAELLAKLECLKRKQALEREEQELIRRKEQLAVETDLAATTGRAAAIQHFKEQLTVKLEEPVPVFSSSSQENNTTRPIPIQGEQLGEYTSSSNFDVSNLMELQRQQNQLTQSFVVGMPHEIRITTDEHTAI